MTGRGRPRIQALLAATAAAALSVLVPAVALAHPLGNFTVNHFAGLTVGVDRVGLDIVLDLAEIPTFTERQRIDTNGDGAVSSQEIEAEREAACPRLATSLRVTEGSAGLGLATTGAGLSFPAGAGGLPTMRLVCEYMASLATPLAAGTALTFADESFADRIGWREITVVGDGVTVAAASGAPIRTGVSVSRRLTHYPADLLSQPLDDRSIALIASPGGAGMIGTPPPDARPLGEETSEAGTAGARSGPKSGDAASGGVSAAGARGSFDAVAAAVPGGVGTELGDVLGARDLTPPVVLGSLLVAMLLGAAHAASPGHGKTIMAAYLVGSRGTASQAVILGLAVTVSHTLGVLALAAITVLAAGLLPPERIYPVLGVASGLLVVGVGAWLLVGRIRMARENGDPAGHGHDHRLGHGHNGAPAHTHAHPHPAGGPRSHDHPERDDHRRDVDQAPLGIRRLLALGLAGGLVPSASALLLLLGSLAASRPLFGLVLVVAFGAGMAVVLAGVGLLLVRATGLLRRASPDPRLARLSSWLPTATAVVVMAAGLVLTGQALHQGF